MFISSTPAQEAQHPQAADAQYTGAGRAALVVMLGELNVGDWRHVARYEVGQVVELSAFEAQDWIRRGWARWAS